MLLDTKILNMISSGQFGCLKEFCIEWEKNQINELVAPPIPKESAVLLYETV